MFRQYLSIFLAHTQAAYLVSHPGVRSTRRGGNCTASMNTRIHRARVAVEGVRSCGTVGFTPVWQFYMLISLLFLTRN